MSSLIRKLTRPGKPFAPRGQDRFEAARDLAAIGPAARRAVPALLRTLASRRDQNPWFLANAVAVIGGPAVVVPLLEHRAEEYLRRAGGLEKAVASIGEAAGHELLVALDHEQWYVREGAALVLGMLRHAPAVEPLLAKLADPEKPVRWAAAEALGKIGDARAEGPLLRLHRATRTLAERRRVAIALDGCGHQPASLVHPVHLDLLVSRHEWNALAALGAASVPGLLQIARDPSFYVRSSVLSVLGRIGDPRAVPRLLAALRDRAASCAAVEALGRIGDARAAEPLLAMLEVELARKVGPTGARLAEALGRLGEQRAVEPLCRALAADQPIELRIEATRALGRVGTAAVADRLTPLLAHPRAELRAAAAEALDRSSPAADLPARLERLIAAGDWPRLVAVGKLAVEPILARLRDEPPEAQPELVRVLGRIADPRAAPMVIDWLFAHPDLITDADALESWTNALDKLLKDYTRIVLSVAASVPRTKRAGRLQSGDSYEWSYDYSWINRGLRELSAIDGAIAVNLLCRVADKPDAEVETGYIDSELWEGPTRGRLSFANQRARARRELARRGNPSADPSAYARPDALRRAGP